jgi:hypothetical protein
MVISSPVVQELPVVSAGDPVDVLKTTTPELIVRVISEFPAT